MVDRPDLAQRTASSGYLKLREQPATEFGFLGPQKTWQSAAANPVPSCYPKADPYCFMPPDPQTPKCSAMPPHTPSSVLPPSQNSTTSPKCSPMPLPVPGPTQWSEHRPTAVAAGPTDPAQEELMWCRSSPEPGMSLTPLF